MTEETPHAPKKTSDKKLFIGLAGLFLLLAAAYALSLGPLPTEEAQVEEAQAEAQVNDAEIEDVEQAYNAESIENTPAEPAASSFDLQSAKKERILGNPSAPIKITEHSSFSCGHCGKFHSDTFDAFKTAYIDTGKAYLVFSDFPLNAPALHASMAARCVSEDKYFDFVKELFATQSGWAYEQNYLNLLEEKAAYFGLDKTSFAECVRNEDLQKALLGRMKAVQGQWSISSTPTFVVNNQEVIGGALSFVDFEKAIEEALAKIEAAAADETPDEGE